jgi:putative ABC transport system permease protein
LDFPPLLPGPLLLDSAATLGAAEALLSGLLAGSTIGAILTYVLVTEFNGVFDPPPTAATVPRAYLAAVAAAIIAAVLIASTTTIRLARCQPLAVLHDL